MAPSKITYKGVIVMAKLNEKYGLFMAVAMVIGSVIGSGVFFKAELICRITGGEGVLGAMAWLIGGASMLLCLLSFSCLVRKYGSENGLVGIAERTVGKRYSYYVGWFMATIYYHTLTSVLAWLSARYTLMFLGTEDFGGGLCMLLSCLYLILSFAQNSLFPAFSGKFQVATTALKLVPLVLMIVFGILKGNSSGILYQNFSISPSSEMDFKALFPAVTASLFAYEGWIAAASIGSELKNSRRNLPIALILGGTAVMAVYVLYYTGILGAVSSETLLNYGSDGIRMAFRAVLGRSASQFLTLFVAISCLGALNGMMIGCGRAMYVLAVGERGPAYKTFSQLATYGGMPIASFVSGLVFSVLWLVFLFGAQISDTPLFSSFSFDSSEMPVVTIYAIYIPMFFVFIMKSRKEKNIMSLMVTVAGICACLFIMTCAIIAHGRDVLDYLITFTAIMLVGAIFEKNKRS